jgi:membrane associated rhomboid family serine protease
MSVSQRDNRGRVPIFNSVPPGVGLILLGVLGVYLIEFALPGVAGWIRQAGVIYLAESQVQLPLQPLGAFAPYLLHVFIHFGFLHVAMNSVILVSTGREVEAAFGPGHRGMVGFLVFFFICSVIGALSSVLTHSGDPTAMAGASTGVSGLIAAAGWVRGGWRGMAQLALPWIGLNLLIGLSNMFASIPIGWMAHIGGTIAGAILFPVLLALFRRASD